MATYHYSSAFPAFTAPAASSSSSTSPQSPTTKSWANAFNPPQHPPPATTTTTVPTNGTGRSHPQPEPTPNPSAKDTPEQQGFKTDDSPNADDPDDDPEEHDDIDEEDGGETRDEDEEEPGDRPRKRPRHSNGKLHSHPQSNCHPSSTNGVSRVCNLPISSASPTSSSSSLPKPPNPHTRTHPPTTSSKPPPTPTPTTNRPPTKPSTNGNATPSTHKDKRKKATRACYSCQKAHLTCDDARPCARCIKRGLADSCADGVRKKAKYLRDYEDAVVVGVGGPTLPPAGVATGMGTGTGVDILDGFTSAGLGAPPPVSVAQLSTTATTNVDPRPPEPQFSFDTMSLPITSQPSNPYDTTTSSSAPSTSLLAPEPTPTPTTATTTFDTLGNLFASNDFGSEAAGYEYAILSSMLNGSGYDLSGDSPLQIGQGNSSGGGAGGNPEDGFFSPGGAGSSGMSGDGFGQQSGGGGGSFLGLEDLEPAPQPQAGPSRITSNPNNSGHHSASLGEALLRQSAEGNGNQELGLSLMGPSSSSAQGDGEDECRGWGALGYVPQGLREQTQLQSPWGVQPTPQSQSQQQQSSGEVQGGGRKVGMTPEEVYRDVTKPYRYTESYHFLIRHLKERFEKNDILRIVRALAIYRPSLIALQMPLTEEDEVFVEKCFQRTLIELDRLISFSGTPTAVWRRTGEISCVGTEFSLLTEWSKDQLLGRKKFIYELFDTSSTVEYYEAFATHAFENTTQAVMTTCVLLTPKGRPVPCTCCFTIKRDLFNCPSLVIGSFLPILGN